MFDPNKRFGDLTGRCQHEQKHWNSTECMKCGATIVVPDFADPREVLKVIMEREDFHGFAEIVGMVIHSSLDCSFKLFLSTDFITIPGLLRDEWIEWKENQNERS